MELALFRPALYICPRPFRERDKLLFDEVGVPLII